jgi:cytochrome c
MIRHVVLSVGLILAATACSKSKAPEPSANASEAASETVTAAPAADPNASFASLKGDAAKGETSFGKCIACHSVEPGHNGLGPSLHGVVGRKAGSADGYIYSEANKASGLTWTGDELFTYLKNPRAVVPGTKMSFAGLPDPQDRADVIAYLSGQ